MQVLAGLLTPTIAAIAIIIAFMQWRTAHQKVVLDLFDRRIALFNQVRDFYLTIVREGFHHEPMDIAKFHHVRNGAAFLFGKEVNALLEDFHVAIINMSTHAQMGRDIDDGDRRTHIRASNEYLREAMRLANLFNDTFAPYMRMDQKLIRTPMQWLRDRNQIRLSYDDAKQR